MHLKSINDLFLEELKDLYAAEQMLSNEFSKLADQASNGCLKDSLRSYVNDSQKQMERLRQAFMIMGQPLESKECEGMDGIIEQANDIIEHAADPDVKDAAIISEVQKMKHYEIASYSNMRILADKLGMQSIASLMGDALSDEQKIDNELTSLAVGMI
ncbi:MAG: DUF892 family protein, partial [Armatimonadota bacterium]|nr:DUF892 family protein [Armatimonadota bacterium]